MYTPPHFLEADLTQLDWLAEHDSFGTLISTVAGEPFASHLPVFYHRDGSRVSLRGHWARANPQWKTIAGQRSLFIFQGPHAYISPRWYAEPTQHVPTWNYAAAHLYGGVRVIHEQEELAGLVSRLSARYEAGNPAPWTFEGSEGSRKLGGIVGFELVADNIQVKFKLNQNHPTENIAGAIAGLTEKPTDDSRAVAALMDTVLSKKIR